MVFNLWDWFANQDPMRLALPLDCWRVFMAVLFRSQETYKTEITNLQDKLRQMEINAGIRDERGKQVDPAPAPSE